MNKQRLRQIFRNYIKKFELINNPEHDENYKWRIAYQFHELMNPDSCSFAEGMKQAWKLTANLIDSSNRYCFSALISCAEKEPEAVRQLFKELFADDEGDLTIRQGKILRFIKGANELTRRLHSTNGMFMNDQRSAMGYLFLYDPDNHYLYKASEAHSFASCIEFYDDWGSGDSFKLDVYYRMCDALVEEIRNSHELRISHDSRFYDRAGNRNEEMHPDENYHILAFDIIYGAPEFRYNFYEGIPFANITAQARKLHEERIKKAQELYAAWQQAQAKVDLLAEAQAYFGEHITVGTKVKSRMLGEGIVAEVDETRIWVDFASTGERKIFEPLVAFVQYKALSADIPELTERINRYQSVVKYKDMIKSSLERAEKALKPYLEYIE